MNRSSIARFASLAALAALASHAGVVTRLVDLEAGAWPLVGERFAAIVVSSFSPVATPLPTNQPARSIVTRTEVDRV